MSFKINAGVVKPVLLLDVDGVVADCCSAVHKFAQRLLKRDLPPPSTWTEWDHAAAMKLTPVEAEKFKLHALFDEFPRSIRLYPGAAESVRALKEHFQLFFATAPWAGNDFWVPARDVLLSEFDCPIIYTANKDRILGDVLCDDKAKTIEAGGPWHGVLFDRPYNRQSRAKHRIAELWELIGVADRLCNGQKP